MGHVGSLAVALFSAPGIELFAKCVPLEQFAHPLQSTMPLKKALKKEIGWRRSQQKSRAFQRGDDYILNTQLTTPAAG